MRTPVSRVLISVADKSGIVPFAQALHDLGIEIVSSGGTARVLADAGVPVTSVETVTGVPEMLDHRVVTLHPKIHGGILADLGNEQHRSDLETHGITPFSMVVVNLYPFVEQPGIETIDVGGPAMVRAAAKNHAWVAVVTNTTQYNAIIDELQSNECTLSDETRRVLAVDAFAATAAFDAAIVAWLQRDDDMPEHLVLPLQRASALRYGENPHQGAARYRQRNTALGWPDAMVQLQGKSLSFINLLDAQAAWTLVQQFEEPACVIVKHANPCGVATGATLSEAYARAFACDDVSAFGGVVACNRVLDGSTAEAIAGVFTEVVIAPGFDDVTRDILAGRANLRLLDMASAPTRHERALDLRSIDGGFLVQQADATSIDRDAWTVVTKAAPTEEQWRDIVFAWTVCSSVTSNAIVLAHDGQAVGIGAGQQSRVHAAEIAARKAGARAVGGVCASDAFFPFRDGIDAAAAAGVVAVVQPGGSVRDDEVIAAADEHGIAMVFTGQRHFRH